MTTGALMFAFNNEGIDYVKLAAWNAERIRSWLRIPVALVTDSEHVPDEFDRVIRTQRRGQDSRYFEDLGRTVTWYNASRPEALDLTPWDRTLLLDADYVISSMNLMTVLESPQDFLAFRRARDITGVTDFDGLNHFGEHRIPMWWATVMIFNRCNLTQYVFDCMKMVRANWQHYRDLYGINNQTYRNDYALTIALGIVEGHTPSVRSIPWAMQTVMPDHRIEVDETGVRWVIHYEKQQTRQKAYMSWVGCDFHAMGKHNLEQLIASH